MAGRRLGGRLTRAKRARHLDAPGTWGHRLDRAAPAPAQQSQERVDAACGDNPLIHRNGNMDGLTPGKPDQTATDAPSSSSALRLFHSSEASHTAQRAVEPAGVP